MITQSRLKELLHYDIDTGIFTHRKARQSVRVGDVSGHVNNRSGYLQVKVSGKSYYAHRLAWFYVYGDLPPDQLDHINRVRTDNRLCNLRFATNAENQQNQSLSIRNKSGHTGVYWNNRNKNWRAEIKFNNKTINLGSFKDLSEAIAARAEAKAKYHTFNNKGVA